MTWEKVKLGDCCISISDGDHQAPPKSRDGIPFITIANIDQFNKIDFTNTMHVPKDYFDSLDSKRKPHVGDIIYSVVGSFGIPVYIKNDDMFTFQRHIAILKCKENINSRFLYYVMKSRTFYHQADSVAIGSAQKTITLSALRDMEVHLPERKVQNKIASILSAYDDLIENNRRQIKLLEEAAERLYKEWFVKFHYPGWENHFHDGKEEGWRNGTLSDIGKFNRGKTIISANIEPGPIPVIAGGISPSFYCNEYNVIGPVITISASGANAGYVNLYHENIWASDCSFLEDSATKYLYWIYCFFKSNPNILINLQKGSAQPHVYAKDVNQIELLIPPERILTSFESEVAALYSQIAKFDRMIPLLLEARDRLLPKLMSGEVEV